MNVPPFKSKTASAERETKPSSQAESSSSTVEASHDELKLPDQTYTPTDKPPPGAEKNVSATAASSSATDRNHRPVADKDTSTAKRRRLNTGAAATEPLDIPLRGLIPPKDCLQMTKRLQTGSIHLALAPQGAARVRCDWSAVIARARSHPREASAPYFGSPAASGASPSLATTDGIFAYKPLHAMLKYDPPLDAVEAVLRANPKAALDVTFEGSALKIAAESGVSSMLVLRLLLVAEMATRKRLHQQQQQQQRQRGRRQEQNSALSNLEGKSNKNEVEAQQRHVTATTRRPGSSRSLTNIMAPESGIFYGYNPIRWIFERRIPAKTAAMLLKWYPAGAFQCPFDSDGAPADDTVLERSGLMLHDGMNKFESPLIEIVDNFSRDRYDQAEEGGNDEGRGDAADDDGTDYDYKLEMYYEDNAQATPRQRKRLQKERRWEKFLHILYATDLVLHSGRRHPLPTKGTRPANPVAASSEDPSTAGTSESLAVPLKSNSPGRSSPTAATIALGLTSPDGTPFRPVHAWIRCLTSPHLGLERCSPYGALSVLRVMGRRIPSEFAKRDAADGDRTVFQTLAESPAGDCRLCLDEVKDVVECLIDADRSAFLPRQIDGRLIGHVALENGWPCKDLFSRKASET